MEDGRERFFITTAIDYANGDPHFGHALEKVGADVIARFSRQLGRNVHFLVGMDEHGQKVAQAAAAEGTEPQVFVDRVAGHFRSTWDRLGISYDQFIRTTDAAHKSGVRALIKRIHDSSPDDFYEKPYEGWYCVGCELFKRDDEIVEGKCSLHPTRELQWTKERNWFFRLSKYQGFIEDLLRRRPDFIQPESRRNEILGLLEKGLEDISITRSKLSWAIPFPIASPDGEPQGTWVWFDALPNYLTATGYPAPGYRKRWPAQLHVVGKDITRLHCVIWPAMLQSAELALPERVWAHGFISFGGERFSKSAGVKLELSDAIERFGPDAFRYFLLSEIPFDADGNFTPERFEQVYTSDLANSLGNLASRSIAMVEKYCGGVVPADPVIALARAPDDPATRLLHEHLSAFAQVRKTLDGSAGYRPHLALRELMARVRSTNEAVQLWQPWALSKEGRTGDLNGALNRVMRSLAWFAVYLAPFVPGKAEDLWAQLGGPAGHGARARDVLFSDVAALDVAGWRVGKGAALFPRPEAQTSES